MLHVVQAHYQLTVTHVALHILIEIVDNVLTNVHQISLQTQQIISVTNVNYHAFRVSATPQPTTVLHALLTVYLIYKQTLLFQEPVLAPAHLAQIQVCIQIQPLKNVRCAAIHALLALGRIALTAFLAKLTHFCSRIASPVLTIVRWDTMETLHCQFANFVIQIVWTVPIQRKTAPNAKAVDIY